MAGQQFGYSYDDIGNRSATDSGGDSTAYHTRPAFYQANLLNEIISRTVPDKADIIGSASTSAKVSVNNVRATRKGEYFRAEVPVDNSAGPVLMSVTNVGVINNGPSGLDIVTNSLSSLFVPPASEALTYDLDGNLSTDGRWTYTWDGENRLVTMTGNANVPSAARLKLDFTYDYAGRRIVKKVSTWNGSAYVLQTTTKFLYDGWNIIAELDGNNSPVRKMLWGLDLSGSIRGAGGVGGLVALAVVTNSTSHFPVYDGNGNLIGAVNASSGAVSARFEYGPFGEPIRVEGSAAAACPFGFSTKLADSESGFVYYGHRYYDASGGKWLQRDRIGEAGGLHLYAPCGNDCINQIDRFGDDTFSDDFWRGVPGTTADIGKRLYGTAKQLGLTYYDIIAFAAWDSAGMGGEYQGASQLYQSIYQAPLRYQNLSHDIKSSLGVLETDLLSLGTLPAYRAAKEAIETGNYEPLQDLFATVAMGSIFPKVKAAAKEFCFGRKVVIPATVKTPAVEIGNEIATADGGGGPSLKTITETPDVGTGTAIRSGSLVDPAVVADLQASGIKITPQNVVATSRNSLGQTVFLETGNSASGLQHIVDAHGADFANVGISQAEIPRVVTQAVTHGRFVGYQGQDFGRPIYEITVNGQTQRIAVTVGDNGYIVGANPAGR